jgi:hypothetical protein
VDPPNVLGLEQSEAPKAEDRRLEHSFGSRAMKKSWIGQRGLQTRSRVGEESLDQSRIVEVQPVPLSKRRGQGQQVEGFLGRIVIL